MFLTSDNETEKTCSFTGYRPHKLSFGDDYTHKDYLFLRAALKKEILALYNGGIRFFQTGMAMGIDMICAELVIELRGECPGMALFAVLPCRNQAEHWDDFNKSRHSRILSECDGTMYITNSGYKSGCMTKRNRRLVDTAAVLLAVFDGKKGGTMNTVRYADSAGKKLIVLDPYRFVRIELFQK